MYYFSPTTLSFYPAAMRKDYEDAGSWPKDAIEVSSDVFDEFGLSSPPPGKERGANKKGMPAWVDVAVEPAIDRRRNVSRVIDSIAGDARLRFVSAGHLIEEEYREALRLVEEWRESGSPTDDVPEAIMSWADAGDDGDPEWSAQSIEQTAKIWRGALAKIRRIRLEGKAAVRDASDEADFNEVAQPFIDKLNAIQPSE